MTTKLLSADTLPSHLIQHAESLIDGGNLTEALDQYLQIISETSPSAFLHSRLGWLRRLTGDFAGGIRNYDQAIALSPDDADLYCQRGSCRSHALSSMSNIDEQTRKHWLELAISDFRNTVKRNPSHSSAWLATLENNLLVHDWDNAIAAYALCRPYLTIDKCLLIRAWLGCLALCLAGDKIEEEDKAPLYDDTIPLERNDWCVAEIDMLLSELSQQTPRVKSLETAYQLHQLFISHFQEEPYRRL